MPHAARLECRAGAALAVGQEGGDVEALLAACGAGEFRFEAASLGCLHPGRTARILRGQTPCGWLGELHPELARGLELGAAPLLFELELDTVAAAWPSACR